MCMCLLVCFYLYLYMDITYLNLLLVFIEITFYFINSNLSLIIIKPLLHETLNTNLLITLKDGFQRCHMWKKIILESRKYA